MNTSLSYGCLTALLSIHVLSCYYGGRALPGEPFVANGERASKDHSELIGWLTRNHVNVVRTNYWIGYRLAFETQEQVKFSLFQAPFQVRIKAYEDEAAHGERYRFPHILVPSQAGFVRDALTTLGFLYKEISLSGYEVIYDIEHAAGNLEPALVKPSHVWASSNEKDALHAIDGDMLTRWGSAAPQKAGMQFALDFDPPVVLRGMRYDLGTWWTDYPRKLEIELEDATGSHKTVLDAARYEALRLFVASEDSLTLAFEPTSVRKIKLTQLGDDPVFDWSIAEVHILQ